MLDPNDDDGFNKVLEQSILENDFYLDENKKPEEMEFFDKVKPKRPRLLTY